MTEKMFKVSTLSFHAGIAGDRIVETYFVSPDLTGVVYHSFLWNVLPQLLQNMNLQTRIHLWFVFNGAPPHSWEFLNNVFLEQWIGWCRPSAWPAHSSAIYPLDFYLWGHLKSTTYATEISDVQDLEQWIQNGFEMILMTPRIFQWASKSVFRHAIFCVKAQGGHLERFLYLSGSHKSDNTFQKVIVHRTFFTCILVYIHLSLVFTCIFWIPVY